MITARFYVSQITRHGYPDTAAGWADPAPAGQVELRPVTGAGNEPWASATPGGRIELTVRGQALPWFVDRLGAVLAITFDDVPAAAEAEDV